MRGWSDECNVAKREHNTHPASWYFLSFADEERFLGGLFVRGNGPRNAVQRARELGVKFVNATVECSPVTDAEMLEHVPVEMREQLLNEEQVSALGGI